MGRLKMHKTGRLWLGLLLLLTAGQSGAQLKGDSYQKWYSWNATAGLMMPLNPFHTSLGGGIPHQYQFSGTPGYIFSLAKQVGLQVIIGADLEDLRMEGMMQGYERVDKESAYDIRLRTYSLTGEYFFSPVSNINPFLLVKAGYGGINRDRNKKDLSRTTPADRWDFMFTAGAGVTYHNYPNFSFNLFGEFTPVPNTYIYEMFDNLPQQRRKLMPMMRIVLTVTAHTDIRVFYPFRKENIPKNKYKKGDDAEPFHRKRVRK